MSRIAEVQAKIASIRQKMDEGNWDTTNLGEILSDIYEALAIVTAELARLDRVTTPIGGAS